MSGDMNIRIELTQEELDSLREIATRRNNIKFEKGVRNQRYTNRLGDFEIHYQGVQCEHAVAKWFRDNGWEDVRIDETISPSGDDKINDIIGLGDVTLQVKSRERRIDGDLFFNHPDLFKAKAAVLTIYMDEGAVVIVGWTDKSNFMKNHNTKNFGYGTRYCLEQPHLRDMGEFLL